MPKTVIFLGSDSFENIRIPNTQEGTAYTQTENPIILIKTFASCLGLFRRIDTWHLVVLLSLRPGLRANRTVPLQFGERIVIGFDDNFREPFHPMDTKNCRNCGGSEFYSNDVSLTGYLHTLVPLGVFSAADVHLRVCGQCGLIDWFISPESLGKLKEKFSKDPVGS